MGGEVELHPRDGALPSVTETRFVHPKSALPKCVLRKRPVLTSAAQKTGPEEIEAEIRAAVK